MADSSVAITAGTGTPIRVLTGLGAGVADQQVITLADSAGNLLGTSAAPIPVQPQDVSAAISIAANATSSGAVTSTGSASAVIQLLGTWSGSVQVQVTADGANWVNITGSNAITNVATSSYVSGGTLIANGIYSLDVAGMSGVRVISITWTSGTVTGSVRMSNATASVAVTGVPSMTPNTGAGVAQVATSSAGTNATLTKSSAGSVLTAVIANVTTTAAYFKLFNIAAAPTVGTSVPVITIPCPASATQTVNFGTLGARFTTGISWSLTGAIGDTDATATVVGIHVHLTYI